MEFSTEGGLLPTQAVGISVTGLIPSGRVGLNDQVEYGSSDTVRVELDGTGEAVEESSGNHVNIGLFVRPDAITGLQIGGSFYHDKISAPHLGPSPRFGQTVLNAHVVYTAHGIEFLSEGFLIRHSLLGAHTMFNMPAFYSQFCKRFGRMHPFFRYQYENTNPNSLFDDIALRRGPSFGTRYDCNESVGFKVQLDHTIRKGKPDLNGLQTQLVFAF